MLEYETDLPLGRESNAPLRNLDARFDLRACASGRDPARGGEFDPLGVAPPELVRRGGVEASPGLMNSALDDAIVMSVMLLSRSYCDVWRERPFTTASMLFGRPDRNER